MAARALHDRGGDEPLRDALIERIRAEPDGVDPPRRRAGARRAARRPASRVHDLLVVLLRDDRDPGVLGARRAGAGRTLRRRRHGPRPAGRARPARRRRDRPGGPRCRSRGSTSAPTRPSAPRSSPGPAQDRAADVRLVAIRGLTDGLATDPCRRDRAGRGRAHDTDAARTAGRRAGPGEQDRARRDGLQRARPGDRRRPRRRRTAGRRRRRSPSAAPATPGVRRQLLDRARQDGARRRARRRDRRAGPHAARPPGRRRAAAWSAPATTPTARSSRRRPRRPATARHAVIAAAGAVDANPRVREAAVARPLSPSAPSRRCGSALLERVRATPTPRWWPRRRWRWSPPAPTSSSATCCACGPPATTTRRAGRGGAGARRVVRRRPGVRELLVALAASDADLQVRREALRVLGERLARTEVRHCWSTGCATATGRYARRRCGPCASTSAATRRSARCWSSWPATTRTPTSGGWPARR